MSAETAAHRYTCEDCRKTYRSFRTREEWRMSHVAQVCPARNGAKAVTPAASVRTKAAPPVTRQAPPPAAKPAPPMSAGPALSAPPQRSRSEGSDRRPGHLGHAMALAAAGIAALLLVAVAFDASRTLLDATSAGSPPPRWLLAAVIAGPCLYGAYRMVRSGVSALPGKNADERLSSPVHAGRQ